MFTITFIYHIPLAYIIPITLRQHIVNVCIKDHHIFHNTTKNKNNNFLVNLTWNLKHDQRETTSIDQICLNENKHNYHSRYILYLPQFETFFFFKPSILLCIVESTSFTLYICCYLRITVTLDSTIFNEFEKQTQTWSTGDNFKWK